MQGLYILMVWAGLIVLGCTAPFVMALAYIWVDVFRPQDVVPTIAQLLPISMITALLAIGAYLIGDRRNPPRIGLLTVLLLLWLVWITLTSTWALFPEHAWRKWDWAFKTIAFTTLLPFVFTSRIRLEAALLILVCSIMSNVLPFALKTLLTGGGYGQALGLVPMNSGWGGEGSTLSTYAFAALPLIAFLQRHSQIAPGRGWMRYVYYSAPAFAAIGTLGTFARAGIIAGLIWGATAWWYSRRKISLILGGFAGIVAMLPLMDDEWIARIMTIFESRQEASALGRILVWRWTFDFATRNPSGGGFDAYRASYGVAPLPNGEQLEINGLAFHSIYFEVLGEQGWIGFAIFMSIIAVFFLKMWSLRRSVRGREDVAWIGDLATALMQSTLIYLAGAAFVGIAYQPLHYYLIMFAVSAVAIRARSQVVAHRPIGTTTLAASIPSNMPSWRVRAGRGA